MNKVIDLTGKKFGKLTIVERTESKILPSGQHITMWKCECECGAITIVSGANLRKGNTKSCGCLIGEKHGMSHTKIHNEWERIKQRCHNPNDKDYKNYGGRKDHKVIVCEKWFNSFLAFYEDVSKLPHYGERGYTLNRINNDGDYEPNNVEWATVVEQNNNKRDNYMITYDGKTLTMAQWARETSIPYKTLQQRLYTHHWSVERALTTKVASRKRRMHNE